MWCIGQITQEYRDRMYTLLDLYQKEYDELRPVICIDEKSKQFLEETRKPIEMKAGSSYKYDYEYKRKGTGNLFVAVEPKAGKRIVSAWVRKRNKQKKTPMDFYKAESRQKVEQILCCIIK